ncbi:hypothetical protein CCMA1212_010685 [Trichoderma ghanense]|uniref:Uncharacterized protein n=1 Tax=Trichoderma ghanense TaxID=65468 RepID=A0ABY2GP21_9HYPO
MVVMVSLVLAVDEWGEDDSCRGEAGDARDADADAEEAEAAERAAEGEEAEAEAEAEEEEEAVARDAVTPGGGGCDDMMMGCRQQAGTRATRTRANGRQWDGGTAEECEMHSG